MSWQSALLGLCGAFLLLCVLSAASSRPKRNRRVGLPAPKPDPRSSIEQFKRIHTP
jgi:hypothetical protein